MIPQQDAPVVVLDNAVAFPLVQDLVDALACGSDEAPQGFVRKLQTEPPRIFRRRRGLSQAANADSFC
jgi:hypothetical protein